MGAFALEIEAGDQAQSKGLKVANQRRAQVNQIEQEHFKMSKEGPEYGKEHKNDLFSGHLWELFLYVNLAGLRDVHIAGKTLLLGESESVFLKEIGIWMTGPRRLPSPV